MSGSGREALPDVQEWLGGPPKCAGVVVRPSRVVGRPSWMSESGWDAFLVVWEWSGGPPGCPGVVWKPSRMSGSGREALTGGQDLSQMSGSGREALPDDREWLGGPHVWSGGPSRCPGVVVRPS